MSTSTANQRKKRIQPSSRSRIFTRLTFGLFLTFGMLGCLALTILILGRCSGEEFSSRDFSRRTFFYYRIPIIKIQVTPIFRSAKSSLLVKHLRSQGLIAKGNQNWELASLQTGVGHPYEAEEIILCRYLDQRNDDFDLRWLAWSQKHTKLARAFWPVVLRVANEDLYLLLPDLFQIARFASDPVQLDSDLRSLIIHDASRIAAGEYQLANYDRAARIAAFVLMLAGDEESWDHEIAAAAESAMSSQARALERGASPAEMVPLPKFSPTPSDPQAEVDSEAEIPASTSATSDAATEQDPTLPDRSDPKSQDDRAE